MTERRFDLRKALENPKAVFKKPEQVVADPRLDDDAKRAILRRWEQDARELAVAEEEGMDGGESESLSAILHALATLSPDAKPETQATTKHGGVPKTSEGNPTMVGHLMVSVNDFVHVDHDLREAGIRMKRLGVPFLPVVDGDELVGVLTARDIYSTAPEAQEDGTRGVLVRDRLLSDLAFCYETDSLATAVQVMEEAAVHRLLVANHQSYLVGLITLEMITAEFRQSESGPNIEAAGETPDRIAETLGRAQGEADGHPWGYTVRPRIKTPHRGRPPDKE